MPIINRQIAEKGKDDVAKFLWLSDIHLDPYFAQPQAAALVNRLCTDEASNETSPYGLVGCDSPTLLLHETLSHAKESLDDANDDIDFILITGDLCRHANDMLDDPISITQSILKTVIEAIISLFPDVQIVASVGNNDFTPDYFLDNSIATNNTLLNMVTDGFQGIFTSSDEESLFRRGAYLSRNVTDALTVISLNTIIYSRNHMPNQTYLEDPLGQFEWLQNQLEQAKSTGRRVFIVGHIPPTLGSYRRSQLWHDRYMNSYYDIVQNYVADVVTGHLFGHLHTDEFRLVHPKYASSNGQLYSIFMGSSITPIYGSNPSYRLVHYAKETGSILDYDSFYFNISESGTDGPPNWIESPSFSEAYMVPDMTTESIQSVFAKMSNFSLSNNDALWKSFLSRQNVHSSAENDCNDELCRKEWLCVISSLSRDEYERCIPNVVSSHDPNEIIHYFLTFFLLLATLALSIGLLCTIKKTRCLKRRQYRSNLHDIPDTSEIHMATTSTGDSHVASNGEKRDDLPDIS